MIARFRFVGPGVDVTGPVQGAGGLVTSLGCLERQQRLASAGRPLGVYEPSPGFVCVFPDYSGSENGRRVHVPIAIVSIEQVEGLS